MHRSVEYLSAVLVVGGVSLTTSFPTHAQEEVIQIPEMIVTSRAREEALQDVPISVSLTSGEMLDMMSIENLEDLAGVVPNFAVSQDPIGDKINIRGIFTSEVPSLEQSVSTFVDGVNRGRGTQSRFRFLDLERVEVLRGPQGTLFGKNTVGGALNLTTRKPTPEFTASFNAGYEPELEERTLGGVISGPLSDRVRGRLAYVGNDQNRGFIENRFYNESTPVTRDNSVRGILDVDVTENTLLRLRGEYQDFDFNGLPFSLRTAGPLGPVLQPFGVQPGSFRETAIGQTPGGALDFGSNGTMEGDAQEFALTLEQQFAAGASLEFIGSFSALDFQRQIDADFSPLDLAGFADTEDYEQTSFSLRFLSSDEGRVRYVGGLYYQQVDLELTGTTSINPTSAQALLTPFCQAFGLSQTDTQLLFRAAIGAGGLTPRAAASQLARAGNATVIETCTNLGSSFDLPQQLSRINTLSQDGETMAAYGQADFDLTSKLQLTIGARYTVEDKEARQTVFASNIGSRTPDPALDLPLAVFLDATPHDFGPDLLNRSESKATYSASLQWAASEQVNTYVSASSGFKAGGFNSVSFGPSPAAAEFDPEEVMAYEVGVKTRLLDGAATFNAAYFFTEIEDLQVAQFTGNSSFLVQNAAEAEVHGLEIDARVQLTKNFGFSVAASYTDFEFTSFRNAGCTTQQLQSLRQSTFAQGVALLADGNPANDDAGFAAQLRGSAQTLLDCSALGINDLEGRTAEQVPQYTAQLGVDYHLELGRFSIDTFAQVVWNDSQFRQTDLDPETESGSFAKTDLTVAFYRTGSPWTAMLVTKNVFDKETFSYVNDAPMLENVRQQIVDAPRTVKLQVQYDFR